MTTRIFKVGRWRLEARVEVWRVKRRPRQRIVLWGARGDQVQFGSKDDRLQRTVEFFYDRMLGDFRRLIQGGHFDHVHFSTGKRWGKRALLEQLKADALRDGFDVRVVGGQMDRVQATPERDVADAEKLAAYTDGRGWIPGEDAA